MKSKLRCVKFSFLVNMDEETSCDFLLDRIEVLEDALIEIYENAYCGSLCISSEVQDEKYQVAYD